MEELESKDYFCELKSCEDHLTEPEDRQMGLYIGIGLGIAMVVILIGCAIEKQ